MLLRLAMRWRVECLENQIPYTLVDDSILSQLSIGAKIDKTIHYINQLVSTCID